MFKKSEIVASYLLEIGAIFLRPNDPFIWSSGIESPIYCDNRIILSFPKIRSEIEIFLSELIIEKYSDVQAVVGTSTAGIPHAAIVSEILKLPMGYVRTSEKSHGRKKMIEGKIESYSKVVVIEDLISTAASAISVSKILRNNNIEVLGIASIFSYSLENSKNKLIENNLINNSVLEYEVLIKVALKKNIINKNDIKILDLFRKKLETL